jgi:hypothetical protein
MLGWIERKVVWFMADHPKLSMMIVSVSTALIISAITASLQGGQAWAEPLGNLCKGLKGKCISF